MKRYCVNKSRFTAKQFRTAKENFVALMIGLALFLNMVSLMGWSLIPPRHTPTPTLVHTQSLLLYTKASINAYTLAVVADMERRAKP